MDVIGLDIGHSTVKVAAGSEHIIFPTAATRAVALHVEEASASAKNDLVRVGGQEYFVGRTALIHTNGNLLDGLRDDWIETDEHQALMVSGFNRASKVLGTSDVLLVMGLPSRLHGAQKNRVVELAVMHLGLPKDQVVVIPQPLGAYMAAVLDKDGQVAENQAARIHDSRWGVIDIGYYTADFGLVDSGVWSAAGARSLGGANVIATELRDRIYASKGVGLSLREADEALRTKSTKHMGEVVDLEALVEECAEHYSRGIIEFAGRVFGERLPTLDGILIAGGAADLVHPHVSKVWKHAITAPAARFTVAEGMRRYGQLRVNNQKAPKKGTKKQQD